MIKREKRDKEAFLREKTVQEMQHNPFLQLGDFVLVAETNSFYEITNEPTKIEVGDFLYAKQLTSNIAGSIDSASRLTTPREIRLSGDIDGSVMFDGTSNVDIHTTIIDGSHTHDNDTITGIDASKIVSGTINIERLPKNAVERLLVVTSDEERLALTKDQIQKGDTVKVTSTKKMYYVTDDSKLNSEEGYVEYLASSDWSTITNIPSEFKPEKHIHSAKDTV